jgi:hypothetical protein
VKPASLLLFRTKEHLIEEYLEPIGNWTRASLYLFFIDLSDQHVIFLEIRSQGYQYTNFVYLRKQRRAVMTESNILRADVFDPSVIEEET